MRFVRAVAYILATMILLPEIYHGELRFVRIGGIGGLIQA
jgi:hypothetical protein